MKSYGDLLIGRKMTRQFQVYLNPSVSSITYSCVHCRAHLADHNDLISKAFQGSQGRAYLFDKVVNVKSASAEDRLLLTGQHRVADLHCAGCNSLLGWKYERAFEASQRYKEGKFIIELAHLIKENRWTESSFPSSPSSGYQSGEATSPVGRPSSFEGQRNDAFTVDSSGDEEAVLLPSNSTTNAQRVSLNSESGTLRRTIENTTTPDLTFEQTSPQLNPVNLGWNDLPLNDDSFISPSFSTYEITSSRSSTVRRSQPVRLFNSTNPTPSAVPLLSAPPDSDSDISEGRFSSVVDASDKMGFSDGTLNRPNSLFPPSSFSTEAVQALSESVATDGDIDRDPGEVVFSAAME